jgi:2-keto-4-pentenoate hydratase
MTPQRGLSNWGAASPDDSRLRAGYGALRVAIEALGPARRGWKVGANDPATQRRLGLTGPVIGPLGAAADAAAAIDVSKAHLPGIEAEIAFELSRDVFPDMTSAEIADSVRAVATAAELIDLDQRFDDLALLVGRNFMHRAYFVAAPPCASIAALANAMLSATLNEETIWQVPVGFILGDPLEAVRCVASNTARLGERLRAGDIILSGVVTPLPIWVRGGDVVRLDAGPLGALELRFAGYP